MLAVEAVISWEQFSATVHEAEQLKMLEEMVKDNDGSGRSDAIELVLDEQQAALSSSIQNVAKARGLVAIDQAIKARGRQETD